MARLSCTYYPDFGGVEMTISIMDTAGGIFDPGIGLLGTDFCTGPEGAIIRQEGDTRSVYQAIQPSSCTFDVLVENAEHESFLADLALAEENRFYVQVDRGGFVVFLGNLLIDEVIIQDTRSTKYWFTINASDGFADLQNIDYSYEDGEPYRDRKRLTDHLKNIFSHLPTKDLYADSNVYVFSGLFAAEMPDHATCPIEQAWVDHSVFQKLSEDKITYLSCYDVLEQILDAFDARLITSGQHIYIVQWNFYGDPTKDITAYVYPGLTMEGASEGFLSLVPIEACENGYDAEAGGVKVLQSPARSVSTTYKHGAGQNWLFGSRYIEVRDIQKCVDAGTIPNLNEGARFHFTGNMRFFLSASRSLLTYGLRFIVEATIKLGPNYYIRTHSITPYAPITLSDEEWTTSADTFDIPNSEWISINGETTTSEYTRSENFEILSQEIPKSSYGQELQVCFRLKLIDTQGNDLDITTYPASVNIENPVFGFVDQDNVLVENTANIVTVLNTVNNTRHFDRTLLIGDGPTPESSSRMTVYRDGEHIDTTAWTDIHSGLGPYTHTEMIARMMIARRVTTLRIKEGAFHKYTNKLEPIIYDGLIYIPLVSDWITNENKTSGEWVNITLGEAAALDHITLVEDDAKLSPGTPSLPGFAGIRAAPIRKTYVGPLSEITPTVDLGNILSLPEDEQAAIVHMFRNGNKMNLQTAGAGIIDFKIYDNSGPKLKPAIPFTSSDKIEINYYL